jgi:hypothetical protein
VSRKSVAIVQSCYIPWKGYFDIVNRVDEFVLYDDRQYTRRDWRNRNRIKTPHGTQWLTVPVLVRGKYDQRIDETRVSEPGWAEKHWRTLEHNYAAAPHFDVYAPTFEAAYRAVADEPSLSAINRSLLETVLGVLGIQTTLSWSTDYEAEGAKTERLVSLCRAAGAAHYVSGPAAKAYLEEERFEEAGIELGYVDYEGYAEYPQLHGGFDHFVTVLDLIFNTGPAERQYLKSVRDG